MKDLFIKQSNKLPEGGRNVLFYKVLLSDTMLIVDLMEWNLSVAPQDYPLDRSNRNIYNKVYLKHGWPENECAYSSACNQLLISALQIHTVALCLQSRKGENN